MSVQVQVERYMLKGHAPNTEVKLLFVLVWLLLWQGGTSVSEVGRGQGSGPTLVVCVKFLTNQDISKAVQYLLSPLFARSLWFRNVGIFMAPRHLLKITIL